MIAAMEREYAGRRLMGLLLVAACRWCWFCGLDDVVFSCWPCPFLAVIKFCWFAVCIFLCEHFIVSRGHFFSSSGLFPIEFWPWRF